ncbi:acyl-CoA dehydrogenase family protein [Amycolatopsis sp. DG1A-15b]|uniref:acyl-CoA dehydrogenase family protein n=1 Tax=Amycolatopsis sp. DG1A-15b TaxID=3052846 RepID=UPI00255BBD62|nr:acyl-CoA dehydrogenase family protein [Amycolatopsis sp. DG1A-15b]WIX89250.1 acyl-CoA dehydrogenase family protein [Amycolatopsis sp. DG1A-15b]
MDFALDDTQTEIAALAAKVLGDFRDPGGRPPKPAVEDGSWRALASAGLLALALPPELDGDGLGVAEVAQVLTEVGRAAAPVPAYAALALGVLPIESLGTPAQRAEFLPPVAAGEALLTAALNEPSAPLVAEPAATARAGDGKWLVSGVKTAVPYAAEATRILTPVTTAHGSAVYLVDPHTDGVTLVPTPTSSGTPEYTVRLDDVAVEETDLLFDRGAVAALHRLALAGALALGDGLLAGALALTVKHVGERTQFGRPLSAFQAVAGQIADVYVAARTVHLAVTSAVWRLASGLDADAELDVAAYWFASRAPEALATCHHLHGGVGVDETYPLHRYSSAVKDLGRTLGGAAHRLGRLGERVAG